MTLLATLLLPGFRMSSSSSLPLLALTTQSPAVASKQDTIIG
jgi:hypothetical protein